MNTLTTVTDSWIISNIVDKSNALDPPLHRSFLIITCSNFAYMDVLILVVIKHMCSDRYKFNPRYTIPAGLEGLEMEGH